MKLKNNGKIINLMILMVAIISVVVLLALNGLLIWGLGLLVVKVFGISYIFTYLQAFTLGLVLLVVGSFFHKS